jgi:hypothetical protein
LAIGNKEGITVGIFVGVCEGNIEEPADGVPEGINEGVFEGVGNIVGQKVGRFELGLNVGAVEGLLVEGNNVVLKLGTIVGFDVG